ncbi:MAG TPA: hypothetical protein VM822_22950 [Pseudolabrys sp.]|jgi:hypothetical protein|nr:hypothetical protein [Pseudolabrys sp.]
MLRSFALTVGLLAALPAMAGEMGADETRRFVIGKMFSYTCFEGTRGQGRVNPDGSVTGTVQFQGSGPVRYAYLPANTLQVRGESVCATLRGMLFQPCFNLERTGDNTFRGAISGFGFAYCEFTRHGRTTVAHSVYRSPNSQNGQPLGLRPSIAADNN